MRLSELRGGVPAAAHRAWPLVFLLLGSAPWLAFAGASVQAEAIAGGVASQELAASEARPPQLLPLGSRLEVTAGTNGLFSFSDVSKQISVFVESRYRLTQVLQLGASFAYRYQSVSGVSDTALQGLFGVTINFPLDSGIQNAFFVSPLVGVTTGQTTFGNVMVSSNTQFTTALHLGKRFALGENVAYAPSIGVVKELSFSPSFTIQPISISVFF